MNFINILIGDNVKSKGFTLVEILVTLLVSSIGLLGLAGLQIHALQHTHFSYQRTLANIQALDMVERMWTHLVEPLSELEEWRNLNRQSLPDWKGDVTAVSDRPGGYLMTISWKNDRFADLGLHSFSYQFYLPIPSANSSSEFSK